MTHSFPKIIWQTHNYKKEDLPEHISNIGGTWKNLNPGWEYRYVDHIQRDEMVRAYPEIYETYKTQAPTFQSDIWRFLVTYEYGGCYADMDSVCVKPLDYLLQDIDPLIQLITVPIYKHSGNTHNYVSKKHSQPMTKVFNTMNQMPSSLIKWVPWNIFTQKVYSDDTISQSFIVQTEHNSIEDVAARHSHSYKSKFDLSMHKVNNYGTIVEYLDFLNQKGLSPSI
jgi:mannosyltransferase OCH1-like enzyme